jgi:TetR/AcrR family transcriptional repressor of nem operon
MPYYKLIIKTSLDCEPAMRYQPGHKQQTRARLLEMGAALSKKDGFGSTGVDSLMASLGLTSGAFYAHFRSKSELLEAILDSEFTQALDRIGEKSDGRLLGYLEAYLSIDHVEDPSHGCVMPALTAEIARTNAETRRRFERRMLAVKDRLRSQLANDDEAWIVIAQTVGAVMIARAMASSKTRKAMLDAVLEDCKRKVD